MRCPLRDLITRRLLLPSLLSAGALSFPFHSAPMTYGKRTSPFSNMHEHFIFGLGKEVQAAIVAGHRRDHARPKSSLSLRRARKSHLDTIQAVFVLVVGHDPDNKASE